MTTEKHDACPSLCETERRRDEAIRRMANTPPLPGTAAARHAVACLAGATRRRFIAAAAILAAAATARAGHGQEGQAMGHVALLGDSIFDNAAYVPAGKDVTTLLRQALPEHWRVSLLARDGGVISHLGGQLASLAEDASHIVVSVGGNDALGEVSVLGQPARSVGESLAALAMVRDRFADGYARMLDAVARRRLPVTLCTIYEPVFDDPLMRLAAGTALPIFNDVITRQAFARGFDLIDLRLVFDDPGDFSNTIEPSAQGGRKLARAIAAMLTGGGGRMSRVFAG